MNSEELAGLARFPEKSAPGRTHAALLLFPDPLLPFLGRYLARQGVDFRVSEGFADRLRALTLSLRQAPAEPAIPAAGAPPLPTFLLNYLRGLARCHLFLAAANPPGNNGMETLERGVLVEYGFRLPEDRAALDKEPAAGENSFLAFIFGDRSRPALLLEPAPLFQTRPLLGQAHPPTLSRRARAINSQLPGRLEIRLELVDRPQPGPVRALYLQAREIDWLARLTTRLPGRLLRRLEWAGDQREGILLLPEKVSLFLFPFGLSLGRAKDNLYLPVGRQLSPRLTPEQLDDILDLAADRITFLTPDRRIEIARADFHPLDHHLLPPRRPAVTLRPAAADLRFDCDPPRPVNSPPNPEEPAPPAARAGSRETDTGEEDNRALTVAGAGMPRPDRADEQELLRRKGLELRRAGDPLGAAVCFGLAGEDKSAAECYRLAALDLEKSGSSRPDPVSGRPDPGKKQPQE